MMPQRVNFYHEAFRPRFDFLAARSIVLFAAGLLGLLVVVSGLMQWRLSAERSAIATLQKNKEAATTRVAELSVRYPVRAPSEALNRTVTQLEREKSRKNRMLALLGKGEIGNVTGFASIFRELALAHTEGVWLTGIGVFEGGKHLLIEGSANRGGSERIPQWIQAITGRPLFQERNFGQLRVSQAEEGENLLKFRISTETDQEIERFWEASQEPKVLQKARQDIEESRKDMQRAGDPFNQNDSKGEKKSAQKKGAKP
ncbi:MAG: hypothetical protein HQM00_14840 [Magnetococcales bacterium]|nr:hypothetical protein [Magnetococcales bacterium]